MKKLIIVIMALITIFSASVSAFALSAEEWAIVDYISNISHDGYNCSLVCKNTNAPTPSMTNLLGYAGTQKTTLDLMVSMYETVTSQGAHFINNTLMQGVFHWYEYGGYCWILFDPDGSTGNYWVGNKQGKILYCDAPDDGTEYTLSAIAGADGYCITDRPAGTTGGGYLGDLCVTQDNLTTIHDVVSHLGGAADYYTVLRIVNGEYRYYIMCTYPNRTQYFVCNTSGQLYYALKDEPDSGGDGDGSSFDATEVITAINSVYDAIDIGFWDVCNWLEAIQDNISSFNTDVLIMSQNMVNGFTDLHNVGSLINDTLIDINSGLFSVGDNIVYSVDYLRYKFVDYFDSLGQTYSKLVTVELSGEGDTLVWSKGNSVQSVEVANNSGGDEMHFVTGSDNYTQWSIANESDGYTTSYNSDTELYDFVCVAPNDYDTTFYYNWCVNGDFRNPKNSTGQTVYTTLGNTINGWRTTQVASTITVEDGYVNLSVTNSSDRYRYFCYDLGTDYKLGYTYTISLLADVNSVSGDVRFRASDYGSGFTAFSGSSISLTSTDGVTLFTTTFKNTKQTYTNSRVEFYMAAGSTCDIDIYAVKVENHKEQSLAFEGYDGNWHFYTDVYTPPNLTFTIDGQTRQLTTALSFCKNGHDRIFYDAGIERWYVYRYSSGSSYELPTADQKILNNCFPLTVEAGGIKLDSLNTSSFSLLEDGIYSVDVDGDAVVTVSYYHYGTWFEYMYLMMGMLYDRIGEVDNTVVNIENTVVDIVQDNDAYNIFYVEKTDGTTESVGDAAKDAAVFVGDILSMFYRLVFDDALDNVDILEDFEGVYSNTEVSVW